MFTDSTEDGDHCSSFRQKNPKAAAYSCPENYQAVLLHKGTAPTVCHRVCHTVWLFFKHCHNVCGQAEYQTYWCVNSGNLVFFRFFIKEKVGKLIY